VIALKNISLSLRRERVRVRVCYPLFVKERAQGEFVTCHSSLSGQFDPGHLTDRRLGLLCVGILSAWIGILNCL